MAAPMIFAVHYITIPTINNVYCSLYVQDGEDFGRIHSLGNLTMTRSEFEEFRKAFHVVFLDELQP
jgi:hypothetical protein